MRHCAQPIDQQTGIGCTLAQGFRTCRDIPRDLASHFQWIARPLAKMTQFDAGRARFVAGFAQTGFQGLWCRCKSFSSDHGHSAVTGRGRICIIDGDPVRLDAIVARII
jgi:hypothetical protein